MYKEQLLHRFSKTLSMVLKQFFEPLEMTKTLSCKGVNGGVKIEKGFLHVLL